VPIPILERLHAVIGEIDSSGHANPMRLTVLKKWFELPGRLPAFGLWVAKRAASSAGTPEGPAGELIEEARGLLAATPRAGARPARADATRLHVRLRAFQDAYQRQKWGSVRVIKDRNLLLVEEGLDLYLSDPPSPSRGYRLAVAYCEHYDPRYGQDLNGPSRVRLEEICSFIGDHIQQEPGHTLNPRSPNKML
jgi:hypothetical protein